MTDEQIECTLNDWVGAGAQMWSYAASHGQLVFRLHRAGVRGNLHVVCDGCSYIQGPTAWTDAALRFFRHNAQRNSETIDRFAIEDASAGVLVRCERIRLEADVAPVY